MTKLLNVLALFFRLEGCRSQDRATMDNGRESSFVTAHILNMVFPGPGNDLDDSVPPEFIFKASFDRWPLSIYESHIAFNVVVDGVASPLRLRHSGWTDAQAVDWTASTEALCEEMHLSRKNCDWLARQTHNLEYQLALGQLDLHDSALLAGIDVCLEASRIASWTSDTSGVSTASACVIGADTTRIVLPRLLPGIYALNLTIQPRAFNLPGEALISILPSFKVQAAHCLQDQAVPIIEHPRHGALLGETVALEIRHHTLAMRESNDDKPSVCLALDGYQVGCLDWLAARKYPQLTGLLPGRHRLEAWWSYHGSSRSSLPHCLGSSDFEVDASLVRPRAGGAVVPTVMGDPSSECSSGSECKTSGVDLSAASEANKTATSYDRWTFPLLFVTGASQYYVEKNILANLIGSVHYWEPMATIEIWDFGLEAEGRTEVASWAMVNLRSLPAHLPAHLRTKGFGAYAAKPWVTFDALRHRAKGGAVLWIDANCELRRPLLGTSVLTAALLDPLGAGAFFVSHPFDFPSPQFHFPEAVTALGCPTELVPEQSLRHCATTFMGFSIATKSGQRAAAQVLEPLVACGLDERCVFPPGSGRHNHRQEQTALNAILCALTVAKGDGATGKNEEGEPLQLLSANALCVDDHRFQLTSDFENWNHPLQPTEDPRDWNAMFFFTRRRHPHKPYLAFLRRE